MIKPNIPSEFVMIDIETLALHPCAVVTQMAVVLCNAIDSTIRIMNTVQLNIDEQIKLGRKICGFTLDWTINLGNPSTIKHVDKPLGQSVFTEFKQLFTRDDVVMCNGASFDFPIIKTLLADCDPRIDVPWSYKNEFCYRTLMRIFPAPEYKDAAKLWQESTGAKAHDALSDAVYQAHQAIGAYRLANGLPFEPIIVADCSGLFAAEPAVDDLPF